ncbi:hypothetical protein GQ55_7G127000 [Panicum hallii var. hallii]|uniref:Uncharacterized protein n=3 Tax=Panicum sect. Panicum TaxID=2100772 RepID=A0A3L6PY11_PANMI|nr:uncharacterized protein LOC112899557 [Panicum hallii]PAN37952.1 hypothetical protein PAHAL_7G135300 [Panicum hallii]PUZ46987.1 hypothetical protein GQ55_7G127000 [Panicum hallii var. hallii]RLM66552.1 uncharacterized protein C2845_PM16G06570 [Panicum miliaceum]
MEVFIHEDYVNKRKEVRREQRRRQLQMLQVGGNPGASREALASRESPRVPDQCLTPTGASPSGVRSPTASALSPAGEAAGWPSEHRRLFDCLKPY